MATTSQTNTCVRNFGRMSRPECARVIAEEFIEASVASEPDLELADATLNVAETLITRRRQLAATALRRNCASFKVLESQAAHLTEKTYQDNPDFSEDIVRAGVELGQTAVNFGFQLAMTDPGLQPNQLIGGVQFAAAVEKAV